MAPAIPVSFAGHKDSKKRLFSEMTGKARRFSRGPSSGFVPDYRHDLENTVDYKGIGSSAQIDTAMTASEDSFATKRRSFSLNADRSGSYGIQKEVFPSSKMSRAERKDLIYKLRMELELVQELRQKLASVVPDVVMVSPNSDIQAFSDDRRASQENFGRPMYSQNKKRPAARIDKSRQKKGTAMRPYPTGTTSTCTALVMKQCEALLNRLLSHQYAWVFNAPVDPVKLNIPDYFTVIKHPMDLGTVKRRLEIGEYVSPSEFAADVRLTFSNAMTYNPPSNDVHGMAKTLGKYFETRWRSIEKKISAIEQPLVPSIGSGYMVSGTTANLPSTVEEVMVENKVKSEPPRRVMTDEEKKRLNAELEPLLEELPENIVDFLKEQSFGDGQSGEDEIEIDIDALPHETLFKLRKLLDDYLLEKQNSQEKVEPCEMEIIHDSGFSNSPMQPGGEEDVDILGGNDPPVTSHSFVSMEKQSAQRNGNGSSSSNSSSESGSSSNDADSDSSLGSEADNAKASTIHGAAKASTTPGAAEALLSSSVLMDKMVSRENVEKTANEELLDGSKYAELNSKVSVTSEADGCKDGEEIPPERQISPEKQYRAALLKNRFADTILKAREKALDKGEKRDPEELERHRREEKARLQAEAKVAEEAKRKAEAKAAAQAKRKREQEREAARQALQQMERTVDINGSSQFLQDLELLRAAARDEQPPNFMEEASPEHSQNLMGSFKMPGMSNPLEQLGLYMKMDQDEEEEEEGEQPVPEKEVSDLIQDASSQEVDGTKGNSGQESEALQQMEQTMDINRNSQFLQDLEMPRAASHDDQPLNFMEETSSKHSSNMMESSKMLGMSNPLEELGLYLKKDADEEEEEEGEQQFLENEASNQLQSASNLEIDAKDKEKEKNVEGEREDGTEEGEREDGTEELQEKGGPRNALEGREREKGGLVEYVLKERKQESGLAKGEQEKDLKDEQQVNVAEDREVEIGVAKGQHENVVMEDKDQENGLGRGHHQSNEEGQQENVMVEEEELKNGAEDVEEKKVVEDGEQEMDVEKMQQENAVQMGEQKTVVEEIQQENAVEEREQEGGMEEGKQDLAAEVKEKKKDTEKEEQEIDVEEIYQVRCDEKNEQENDVEEGEQEGGMEERRDDGIEEMQKENSVLEMHQEDVVEEMHQENAVEEGDQESGMKEKQDDGVEDLQKENSVMEMHQEDVLAEIHQQNAVEEGEKEGDMKERQDDGMDEMQRENAMVDMHPEDIEEEMHQENAAEDGVQEGGLEEEMQDYVMKETDQEDAVELTHQKDAIEEMHRKDAEEMHPEVAVEEMHPEVAVEEMHREDPVEGMHPENAVEEGEKKYPMVEMHQEDVLEQKSCMEAEMRTSAIQQESGMVDGRQDIDMEEGEQGNNVEEMKQETSVEDGSKE